MRLKFSILFLSVIILFSSFLIFKPEHSMLTEIPELESAHVEYYSSIPLRESPYPRWRGIIRLTEKQSQNRNHYRFEYDDQFRLIKISFQLGQHLQAPNHTANYFFTNSVIHFSYQDNLEIRTFSDRFGNPSLQRGAHKEVFTKDKMGKYQSLHFENEQDEKIENDWGISEYQWQVQQDGAVIEKRFNLAGEAKSLRPGFEFYNIRLYYEENGMLAIMQYIDEEGQLVDNSSGVAQDRLHFDQQGRWYGWTVMDAQHKVKRGNGPNVARGINVPNEWGYEASIHYEDEFGNHVKNNYGFWGSKRFYDTNGNYNYTQFIDKNGNPGINEKSGYSIAQYHWSEDGLRRLQVDLLDVDRRPVLHHTRGYWSIKMDYDRLGNRIRTTYLGLDGQPINRMDNGVAYLEYRYNAQHQLLDTKRFDQDGKILN